MRRIGPCSSSLLRKMSDPLVTCLCLTRNRREWLKKAIACFDAQSYENRELLIIADATPDVECIPIPLFPRCRVYTSGPLNVGRKRNFGCALALGSVIAICDDDDYSAPGRLANQIAHMQTTGKAVTGYSGMKVTDGENWWQYRTMIPSGFVMATSLCFTKAFWERNHFEPIQEGQDEAFASAAVRAKELASQPDLDLMHFTSHAGNTSPRQLPEKGSNTWKRLYGFDGSVFQNAQ